MISYYYKNPNNLALYSIKLQSKFAVGKIYITN